jgi:hypothetical protein
MGHEFLTVYNYHNRKGKDLSSQGKITERSYCSLSGSNSTIFLYPKSTFFGQKIAHCYAHCKKIDNVFAYSSRTGSGFSNIPTDLDSAGQTIFSMQKNS